MTTNKNSIYVQSLVDFILDTKPYHSKLTEIVEEYRFADSMAVKIDERLYSSVMTKAAWPYTYFSNGVSSPAPQTPIKRVVNPLFSPFYKNNDQSLNRGAFKVGRDENTDLPLVPMAFDPKSIQGVGLADAFVQRNGVGTANEALLEGHDVFLSKGAFVFSIKQTMDAANQYIPLFTERRAEGVLAHASAVVQAQALNKNNPGSAISLTTVVLNRINTELTNYPDATAQAALNDALTIIAGGLLPTTYEALIDALVAAGTPLIQSADATHPYQTWEDVHATLSSYVTSLYMNEYNDMTPRTDGTGIGRESGALEYNEITDRTDVSITNITPDAARQAYEEFTLEASTATTLLVRGTASGLIGVAIVGTPFTSPQLSFTITKITDDLTIGDVITLTPTSRITIHPDSPLEAWSIIKTNPMSYSRPAFGGLTYGYLMDSAGAANMVTVIYGTFPSGTVVIAALNSTTFSVTSTGDNAYHGVATVNSPFNDGRLAFTIVPGSYTFQSGDKFFVEIQNDAPVVQDLDLFYGFDMGPYDGDTIEYNTINSAVQDYLKTLDFGWDSRFTSYDTESFNLQISQAAANGVQWRLRALPNLAKPLLLQNSSPTNQVNLLADNDPSNPNATTQFDSTDDVTSDGPQSASDPDVATDLRLWYADSFGLEHFNESTSTWVQTAVVPVGQRYTNATIGMSFTIVPAAKPFIAATLISSGRDANDGFQAESIDGGDVISWSVVNNPPMQTAPASLSSPRAPRLVMRGERWYFTPAAKWTLTWTSSTTYTLTAVDSAGQVINGAPVTVNTATQGLSYYNHDLGVAYSIVPGVNAFSAGDNFTFETFAVKPTLMVYGSVSGWQPDALYDKWYWNGKIGFKIKSPITELFVNGTLSTDSNVVVTEVRPDTPSAVYTIKALNDDHWVLYRDGNLVNHGTTLVADKYVRITVPGTVTAGTVYTVSVQADDYAFALGNDLVIIRTDAGRAPSTSDFVLLSRTKADGIRISITPKDADHAAALAPLNSNTIDLRYIDITANSGVPLQNTSPEVAVLQGWIPALTTPQYSANHTANFDDPATLSVVTAAATGEVIGTVIPAGSTGFDNVQFKWDSAFAAKYLPLNAQATILTLGSGMDDRVQVNMTEGLQFLISAGGLAENALFADHVNVNIVDANVLSIKGMYDEVISTSIVDGPFGGFLPGYDNTPYDLEDGVDGYYDAGLPTTEQFMLAKKLAMQNVLTPQEQATYNDLLGLIGPITSDPASMSLEDFLAVLNSADVVNSTSSNTGFGIPSVGMAMSVDESTGASAAAHVEDAMTIFANDLGYTFDQYGYDDGPMDGATDSTSFIMSSSTPPLPSTGLPAFGTSYADFTTPLFIVQPGAHVIQLQFPSAPAQTPVIYAWRPTDAAPRRVSIVKQVSSTVFRFSVPAPSELKLIVL